MGKYFGTDGFRGEAGVTLTSEHAYKIGRFLGWYYAKANDDFDFGIMISASHNPFSDNGIKLVNRRGEKMDDETIAQIELYLDGRLSELGISTPDIPFATGENLGEIVDYAAGRNRYIGYLISLSRFSFKPFRVGLDCANGSAWMIAKSVFEALGAKVSLINASPDGFNINRNAGSTHIGALCRHVQENNLDLGFAFDGDADRCIAVDEKGNVVNGDHILYILAVRMKENGKLANNTVVTTIMSNMGLYKALEANGMKSVQTNVGDKYVAECMMRDGYDLGGEQSGHIIFSKYATTGDGILTSLMVMQAMIDKKLPLSMLSGEMKTYPQVLKNVRVADKQAARENPKVKAAVAAATDALGKDGRILVRESGTEPLIRVMVEAKTNEICEQYVDSVIAVIKSEGLEVHA